MTRLIRRKSMEHLQLYDLEQFQIKLAETQSLSGSRPSSGKVEIERYQFLCNANRNRTDPIYAATPMFTTIPSSHSSTGSSIRLSNTHGRYSTIKKQVIDLIEHENPQYDGSTNI